MFYNQRKYNPNEVNLVIDRVKDYFDDMTSKGLKPNPAGLRLALGLTKQQVSDYRNKPEYGEFNAVLSSAYDYMESCAWEDTQTGKGEFGKFYLSRVAKYSEMQKIESKTEHSGSIDITQKIQTALKQANE
jgi:hypothetical protein